jgi:hypothetical protein
MDRKLRSLDSPAHEPIPLSMQQPNAFSVL